jgi:hypothetical protein
LAVSHKREHPCLIMISVDRCNRWNFWNINKKEYPCLITR